MNYYGDGNLDVGKASLVRSGLAQWMSIESLKPAAIAERCTVDVLRKALSCLDGVEVVSAAVNGSGEFVPPQPHWIPNLAPVPPMISGLPHYCEVLVHKHTPGDHVAKILVWVPLAWNRRLLATGGMGSVTGPVWFDMPTIRTTTMPIALRNGFATTATDAGNRDTRFFEWPLDRKTGALDWELLRNWSYRSTHDMAVVAKAVIEALHGTAPAYSYYAGCSGGGRQGLASVQRYPDDFDGVWASDPAINWAALWASAMWPALLMKELHNPLPAAKLEAFRAAAIKACDGVDGLCDGIIGMPELGGFDPLSTVGQQTPAGEITKTDAEVMRRIWDGPRRANGERIWYGLPPGTIAYGPNGAWRTAEIDGELVPQAGESESFYRWIVEDPDFVWTTMDLNKFEELTDLGMRKFAEFASNDPDLSGLRASGGKLIISQGLNDDIVPSGGVVDYYRRVIKCAGGEDQAKSFVRLFVTDGDVHGHIAGPGPGLTTASAMTALMEWVENGKAPDEIIAERVDISSGAIIATRPVYPYPTTTRYGGVGDPNKATSFVRGEDAEI